MTLQLRSSTGGADPTGHTTTGAHRGSAGDEQRPRRFTPRVLRAHPHDETATVEAELQLEDVWDRHGTPVYTLACALLGNETAAAEAVTLGLTDLSRSDGGVSAHDARRSWARHVYWRSQELASEASWAPHGTPALGWLGQLPHPQRVCLALCLFGGHTHREAADLLDVPTTTVADLLTSGLRAVKNLETSATAAHA